ncbi:hypothetical protein ABI59_21505 [Acidobacteria bacterium Mor1]|nr:hypothetical protein ABI59_21505 [Acidobacteria bacterium Mor1]
MVRALNEEPDPQKMLESILDKALAVVQAERGMILLRNEDSNRFHVHLARNLEQETIQDVEAFSASVVERAGGGEAVLAIDAGEDDRFSALKSVHLHGIRSLMCVPLRSRGKIVGAVYVDSRSTGALFTSDDLEFIEAFADHAALALQNARERQRLEGENRKLREAVTRSAHFDNIVGASPAMEEVFLTLGRVAGSELPVLIHGESGTGKELAARAVHYNSARRDAPFVSESCAAVPSELMESTLFGHRKGAFTGAIADHRGLFQQADGGTLFLDEVGDMPQEMQARLLRVLQEREVRPIGGERAIPVDVRIVTATHRDLLKDVAEGEFREDLLYRLRVLVVELPPLRERVGDVPLLVHRFLEQEATSLGRRIPTVSPDVMRLLERYRWPGNVRELQNYVQRLTLLAGPNDVTLPVLRSAPDIWAELSVDADSTDNESRFSLARNEKERIEQALEAAGGNRTRAAKLLGIGRATLYRKMQQYRLE